MDDWVGKGKVRARLLDDGTLEAKCNGLTTQAKYYKPLFKEFFRKDFHVRPTYGDFEVHIIILWERNPKFSTPTKTTLFFLGGGNTLNSPNFDKVVLE